MQKDLLKKFLVDLPLRLGHERLDDIKVNLFKALYYAATSNGEFLDQLFPEISDLEILELENYGFPLSTFHDDSFFRSVSQSSYSHPADTACARALKKGEPVYRCEECGFDSSCVLCVHCFNENDHIGHNVQMYLAREATNGICDCGDPEAFVSTLNCKCQIINEPSLETELNPNFYNSLKETLTILLDYILDVTNFSIAALPFIHDHINKGHCILSSEALSDFSSLPELKYGTEDTNSNSKWLLVLWNDDHHNFPEAKDAITSAIEVDHLKAHDIASDVNLNGRCILKVGDSPVSLFKALDAVEFGGLVATISSERDYIREEMVGYIFDWFLEVLTFGTNVMFRETARTVFGELLLEPQYQFAKSLPVTLIEGLSIDIKRRCFENGLLYGGEFVNGGLTKINPMFEPKDLTKSSHLILTPTFDTMENSRLQFLLMFSIRFKATIRKVLCQIILPPVLTDQHMKSVFCRQYIQIYPQLLTSLALADREEHLNCIADISSQLMTCPTSVLYILESGNIGKIFGPLAQLIEEHAGKWNYDTGYPNFFEPLVSVSTRNKSLYEAITRALTDVNYLVDPVFSNTVTNVLFQNQNMALVLLLLRNFQGYWPIERKYGDHVEREILDFVIHLKYSAPILKIAN